MRHYPNSRAWPMGLKYICGRSDFFLGLPLPPGCHSDAGFFNMEAIIFIGIQGSGKTTFYRERFSDTYVRVSLDLLKTRSREKAFLETCWKTGQLFVIDNTNPRAAD